jgi:hypothetical protein
MLIALASALDNFILQLFRIYFWGVLGHFLLDCFRESLSPVNQTLSPCRKNLANVSLEFSFGSQLSPKELEPSFRYHT